MTVNNEIGIKQPIKQIGIYDMVEIPVCEG